MTLKAGGASQVQRKAWKWIITSLSIAAAIVIILAAGYTIMNSRTFQFYGRLVSHGDIDKKVVYLTFDDGPTKNTGRILETLDALDVKATFFLIGKNMEENPALTRAIYDAGHDIGNHSYTHTRLIMQSPAFIKGEVDKTNAIIKGLGYGRQIFFRPPNCKKLFLLPYYLDQTHQTTVTWTLEPESYPDVNKDAQSITNYVVKNITNGDIILLHPMDDDSSKTLDAIKLIVTELRRQGYTFARLSDGI